MAAVTTTPSDIRDAGEGGTPGWTFERFGSSVLKVTINRSSDYEPGFKSIIAAEALPPPAGASAAVS
jgi:hypothetical protein